MDLSDQMNKYFAQRSAAKRKELQRQRYQAGGGATGDLPPYTLYVEGDKPKDAPADAQLSEHMNYVRGGEKRMIITVYPTPTYQNIAELAHEWDLHPMLVEDLMLGSQRPKLERHKDVTFMVVRAARYIDESEEVDFSEFHILLREDAVAILCQDHRWLDGTTGASADGKNSDNTRWRNTFTEDEKLLKVGPVAAVYQFLDEIISGYLPVLRGLGIDKEQIERQVFSGDQAVAERIYRLSQEIIDTQHASNYLAEVMTSLRKQPNVVEVSEQMKAYLDDATDYLTYVNTTVAQYREAMSQILSVNATLVQERQNEDMKKISGWAAILFAPTLVGAIYGMNFDNMPELHMQYGYPLALVSMLLFGVVLYIVFKRSNWL